MRMVLKEKFENKTLKNILKNIPDATMKVGWNPEQKEENGMQTAEVAWLNETGHNIIRNGKVIAHVVARPFISLSAETYQNHWHQAWRQLLRGYIAGKFRTFQQIMNAFCREYVIEDIRRLVVEEKPFAPNYRTNKKTGQREFLNKTPLIDGGTMIATMTYKTEIKGDYRGHK